MIHAAPYRPESGTASTAALSSIITGYCAMSWSDPQ